jgi:hypothetical protein
MQEDGQLPQMHPDNGEWTYDAVRDKLFGDGDVSLEVPSTCLEIVSAAVRPACPPSFPIRRFLCDSGRCSGPALDQLRASIQHGQDEGCGGQAQAPRRRRR